MFLVPLLIPISLAQIGQYYSKVLPAYIRPHLGTTGRASNDTTTATTSTAFKDPGSSALQVAKAWEAGQRAARHFLAARAYFAPFEHGPTSVILALDLCNLYLFLAEMGETARSRGGGRGGRATATSMDPSPSPASGAEARDGMQNVVPIPSLPGSEGSGETEAASSGRPGLTTMGGGAGGGGGGEGGADHRLRPTAAVRFQCLEGALRSLLDTQSVFSDADIDLTATAAAVAGQPLHRLTRLLKSVMELLPKVLQALVRASVALESSSSSPSTTSVFKSMYRTSLMALRGSGEGGARAVLARMIKEYDAVGKNEVADSI